MKNKITILLLGIAFFAGCGMQEPIRTTDTYKLFEDSHKLVDSCFTDNLDNYISELFPGFELEKRLFIVITDELDNAIGQYLPAHTIVVANDSRQLAVFGHEYVRAYCFETQECDAYQNSYDWSGVTGEHWERAEDLARELCG